MIDIRNEYGFPVAALEQAQVKAAEVRARNFPPPCQCATCLAVEKLPQVQRILARWPMKGPQP